MLDSLPVFEGFSREFMDFLFRLQLNNTLAAAEENKTDYKRLITQPLTQLFHALIPVATALSPTITTKPSKCISTMYSDMRFSRDKPMKEYMYIRFREPDQERDILGLYFDMGKDRYSYGLRIYKQTAAGMARIRDSIIDSPRGYAEQMRALEALGMTIHGDMYAKDRFPENVEKQLQGIDGDQLSASNIDAIKSLYNRKHFYICKDCPINESVFTRGLALEISNAFAGLEGLYQLIKFGFDYIDKGDTDKG